MARKKIAAAKINTRLRSAIYMSIQKIWHGSKKLKKWTQDLYKLCNKVLSDSNKAIPAERVV